MDKLIRLMEMLLEYKFYRVGLKSEYTSKTLKFSTFLMKFRSILVNRNVNETFVYPYEQFIS